MPSSRPVSTRRSSGRGNDLPSVAGHEPAGIADRWFTLPALTDLADRVRARDRAEGWLRRLGLEDADPGHHDVRPRRYASPALTLFWISAVPSAVREAITSRWRCWSGSSVE